MKVGFVSSYSFTRPGGVQNHILNLKKEFAKLGVDSRIIVPRTNLPQRSGKDFVYLGGAVRIPGNASFIDLSLALTPVWLTRYLRKEKFDILHYHNFSPFLSFQILMGSQSKNVLTMHALFDASKAMKEGGALFEFFSYYLLPQMQGIIAVSQPVKDQIKGYSGPVEVIPNGIDFNHFQTSKERVSRFVNKKLNVVFVGRLEKRKGVIYLLQAFGNIRKEFTGVRLIIVGDGVEKNDLVTYVRQHKIPDVFFVGAVSDQMLANYYRTADICVFPALYGESFGIVLLEAMACGKPIVAFANPGYKEILKDQAEDCLVEPKDVEGLAKKVSILLNNSSKRKDLGEWGKEEAQKYTWDKVAKRVFEFYSKC